jgi:lipopolysaccharide transport system ATP-binding protein
LCDIANGQANKYFTELNSMSDLAITVEGLSKKYMISHERAKGIQSRTLRDAITDGVKRLFARDAEPKRDKKREEFWALRNISFDVKKGDRVGIIGKNGAGKSTLLKILSRITVPTTGRFTTAGRVASLLEVGTGFHMELTGRENIFLNGAIIGMKKADILKRFDEIVEFSEVEKFLDTPVKRYSSGMFVRLAFSVAAHLESEILIVDEVLAVGDLSFQKKCLGKMSEATAEGRTVLFVSHNMASISFLCNSALLLSEGEIIDRGEVSAVQTHYVSSMIPSASEVSFQDSRGRQGSGGARFISLRMLNQEEMPTNTFVIGDDIAFDVEIEARERKKSVRMSLDISTSDGVPVYHLLDIDSGFSFEDLVERAVIRITLRNSRLYPGDYLVSLWLGEIDTNPIDYLKDCAKFTVAEGGSVVKRALNRRLGLIYESAYWERLS